MCSVTPLLTAILSIVSFFLVFASSTLAQPKVSRLLPVKIGGRWGYINTQGRIVIRPRFVVAADFSEGLAAVRDEDGWFYYIDQSGQCATGALRFRYADRFSEGLAAVQRESFNDRVGFIDRTGKFVIPERFDSFTGKILGRFENGVAFVIIDGKVGFIDHRGDFVINADFDADSVQNASEFHEGLALIRKKGLYGYVDRSGTIRISPRFATADPFSEGL